MKSLALTLALTLSSLVAHAVPAMTQIKIDKKTPKITPSERIHQFEEIDWDKVETRQDAGKENGDTVVMMCDDTYLELVEIKLSEGLSKDIKIESDCELRGVSYDMYSPAWIQFDGPNGTSSCNVKIQKTRPNGKKPLVVEYDIHDAC